MYSEHPRALSMRRTYNTCHDMMTRHNDIFMAPYRLKKKYDSAGSKEQDNNFSSEQTNAIYW